MEIDPWKILGVSPRATLQEIKQAYRRKVRACHPDVIGRSPLVDSKAFFRLRYAYEQILQKFDKTDKTSYQEQAYKIQENYADEITDGAFLFLEVTAKQAIEGAKLEIKVTDEEDFCPRCNGAGRIPGKNEQLCKSCHGTGHQVVPWGDERLQVLCTDCGGTGFKGRPLCPLCHGQGRICRERNVCIRLPRGTKNGTLLKLPGQGPWRPERGSRDPLYVEIKVELPGDFVLKGLDVHSRMSLDIWTALSGGIVTVPTVEGEAICKVPPGVSQGATIRVHGKGWVDEIGNRGDHVLKIDLELPKGRPSPLVQSLIRWLRILWPVKRKGPLALPR